MNDCYWPWYYVFTLSSDDWHIPLCWITKVLKYLILTKDTHTYTLVRIHLHTYISKYMHVCIFVSYVCTCVCNVHVKRGHVSTSMIHFPSSKNHTWKSRRQRHCLTTTQPDTSPTLPLLRRTKPQLSPPTHTWNVTTAVTWFAELPCVSTASFFLLTRYAPPTHRPLGPPTPAGTWYAGGGRLLIFSLRLFWYLQFDLNFPLNVYHRTAPVTD